MSGAAVLAALLPLAAKATVILALAALADHSVLRRASASTRHLLWCVAIGATLALPIAAWLAPALDVPLKIAAAPATSPMPDAAHVESIAPDGSANPSAGASAPASLRVDDFAATPVVAVTSRPRTQAGIVRVVRSLSLASVIVGVYAAGVLLLLGRVVAERRLVYRLEHGATPVRDVEWNRLLQTVADRLGVRRKVAIFRGPPATMPLTWGVRRPAVLIPQEAGEWTESRRRAVLLHELAHVTRFDCLTQTIAAIACAVYWPHPGIWWAAARLRIERELACDDRALLDGVPAHDYAGHLLEIAREHRVPAGLHALAVSMATRSHLEARLLAAIDATRSRGGPSVGWRAAGIGLALVVLLPLAALRGAAVPAPAVRPRPVAAAPTSRDSGASEPRVFQGDWALNLASAAEAGRAGERGGPIAHVMLWDPGLNTFYVALDSLAGLSAAQIESSTPDVLFILRRDAGTFTFTGRFADGRGKGRFEFVPDSSFTDSLARRGIAAATPEQQFSLARHGASLAFVDALAARGYSRPGVAALVRAGMSSADQRYLTEMSALGYTLGSLDALVSLSNQGVTPEYVREMAALGYRDLTAGQLVRLRNHSLDAPRVRALNEQAGRRLAVDELVALRMRGDATRAPQAPPTDAPPIPAAAARSSRAPTADTPLEGRWVITPARSPDVALELQWSDDTQWRRSIPVSELRGVGAEQLAASTSAPVAFRIEQDAGRFELQGSLRDQRGTGEFRFVPNREFVPVLRSLGIHDVGDVSDHQLKNLAFGGISAAAVRGFRELGFSSLTLDELLGLAVRIVSPEYVRAMRDAGVAETETVEQVVELRFHNVSPEYARALAALGYRGLTSRQLLELHRAGVTPEVSRALRDSSCSTPSVDALLRLMEEAKRQARTRS